MVERAFELIGFVTRLVVGMGKNVLGVGRAFLAKADRWEGH